MKKTFLLLSLTVAMLTATRATAQITTFPWSEGFENNGTNLPTGWTQERVYGTTDWSITDSAPQGTTKTPHSGSYMARFFYDSKSGRTTKLVTPALNLSSIANPTLNFWHVQEKWSSDQDTLRVYYKTSATGAWTLLQTYSSELTTWTKESITLPNRSTNYYIAFEGKAQYGDGILLDDITVLHEPFDLDARAAAVISPTTGGATASTITVQLQNLGVNTITGMNVKYQLNSNAVVTQAYSGTLTSGNTTNFTFTATADLSALGTHTLKVWTDLTGDLDRSNDTTTTLLYNTLDAGVSAILSPHIGGSDTAAITVQLKNIGSNTITGMNVCYQLNSNAVVTQPYTGRLEGGATTDFTFDTRADLSAFGTYTLKVWTDLIGDENRSNDTINTLLYNTLDASIIDISSPTTGGSESAQVKVRFKNQGTFYIDSRNMNMCYQLNNNNVVTQAYTGLMLGGWADQFTFTTTVDLSAVGTYTLKVWTDLEGDMDRSNDTATVILYTTLDAGVTAITSPSIGGDDSAQVKVTLKNQGTATITGMNVCYRLNSNDVVTQAYTGNLTGGATADFTFDTLADLSAYGIHTLRVWTELTGDENRNNDMITVQLLNPFCGGNGSEAEPFLICHAQSLASFATAVNEGSSYEGKHVRLTTDIDLSDYTSGTGWVPIGIGSKPFKGHFNGDGHSITNLTINRRNSTEQGLFGYLSGGSVSRLSVERVNIRGSSNVGAIAGYATYTARVDSCFSSGKVQAFAYVGGIVGKTYNCLINSCYSTANASGTSNDIAGIAGNPQNQSVTGCYAMGAVDCKGGYVGGIVSYNGNFAKNCVAINESIRSSGSITGRIAGSNTPTGCYAYRGIPVNDSTVSTSNVNGRDTTMEALRSQAFYSSIMGWDFNTWRIWEGNSHPYFSWQSAPVAQVRAAAGKVSGTSHANANKVELYSTTWALLATATPSEGAWVANLTGHDTVFVIAYEPGKAASYDVKVVFASTETGLQTLRVINLANSDSLLNISSPSQTGYSISVANNVSRVALSASAKHPAAQLRYDTVGMANLQTGEQSFSVTVVAEDTTAKQTYSVKVKRQEAGATLSNDSTLQSISINGVNIAEFHKDTLHYTVNVLYAMDSITVDAAATYEYARASVSDFSLPKSETLSVGSNSISISVLAENGVSRQTYTLTVVRAVASADNALKSVTLTPNVALTPDFHPDSTSYSAKAPYTAMQITITGVPNHAYATMPSGASMSKTLSTGDPITITLSVRSERGVYRYYRFTVTREAYVPLEGLALNPSSLKLPMNNTRAITPVFTPANAGNKQLTWTSSDSTIAKVDGTGKVTALALGVATITATAADGGYTATCSVTVTDATAVEKTAVAFALYPNPATGKVYVDNGGKAIGRLSIYNLSGELMRSYSFGNQTLASFSVAELTQGLYLVRINGATQKLMVLR